MSAMLMVQAMKAKVGNTASKMVLVKLAECANDDTHQCWPSMQHIADHCEMGKSTVKKHIKALAELGFISVTTRNDGNSSNLYTLTLDKGQNIERTVHSRTVDDGQTGSGDDPVTSEPGHEMTPTGSGDDPLTGSGGDPRTCNSFEPVIEPKTLCAKQSAEQRFAEWYENYPNKKSRARALKAFTKLNPDDLLLQRMIHALKSQIENRERAKTAGVWAPDWKHPETWLNGQCWEDDLIEIPDPHTGGNHDKASIRIHGQRLSTVDRQHAIVRQRHAQREGERGGGRFSDAVVASYE
ncbi:helix-turn-helix domain-containing protein [Pontibacter sp. JAM-7]|uniref:helix-turn-helix domain-containing protein n=1 Tax=Pontibacter sp. JAM-7 TaxID=3366581 RepID=UPI003AF992D4